MRLTMRHLLTLILLMYSIALNAQDSVQLVRQGDCDQKDLPDVIRDWRNKPPKQRKEKNSSLLLVPVIASNPATGFQFGAAGQYVFKGKQPKDLYSSISGNATVTSKGQTMLQLKNNIYLKNNKIFLSGDWRLFLFSQSTYGLGTNTPEGGILKYQYGVNGTEVSDDSLVQPMKFNHFRFYQSIYWKVSGHFYMGFGYNLDKFSKINDLKLDTVRPLYTSHYSYSKRYGFSTTSYKLAGLNVNLMIDTRDNMINPYKGIYANLIYRLNPEFLGSELTANVLSVEWRSYHSLSKTKPRKLIGFWLLGTFTEAGRLPYMVLPALGYDQRGRSGRGYTQGRYRGQNMLYLESEYRFPISPCSGVLGGVLFANVTTSDRPDKNERLFDYMAPGYGFGLRMMVDKHSRTNLQVDFGFGKKSAGIYFGAAETF
ncbi:BamA/TamA family outer membrane protein [Flavihumibacter rivuli]|uniref:BamA/TamA family outer membrane protein n=1 Tax=Flavihumibacter rivuli TaxID=2838156 RepID=UPI001BDEE0E0|nr:BamA/TamA family outer membrane protein [Flavihumibacter rivuli]ULQ55559.1 BamA/TamA family outer membrane protein [Flavihumibacter rivuli]